MNFDDMRYLVCIAEHRHIGRAAEALGLTQPALTRAVARMEAIAGQALFTRHPKGVEPTPAGRSLLHRAQRINLEYEDAMREMAERKSGQLGLLRVGYTPSVNEEVLLSATQRLLNERPAVRLKVSVFLMQDLIDRLVAGELDLILGPVPEPLPPEITATVHYRDRVVLVVDCKHPLLRVKKVRLQDVGAEPWLLPSAHIRVRRVLEQRIAEDGLPPLNVRVESDSLSTTHFRLLRGTRMIGVTSEWVVPSLRKAGLEVLTVVGMNIERDIASMRRTGGYTSPLSERLDQLFQHAAN